MSSASASGTFFALDMSAASSTICVDIPRVASSVNPIPRMMSPRSAASSRDSNLDDPVAAANVSDQSMACCFIDPKARPITLSASSASEASLNSLTPAAPTAAPITNAAAAATLAIFLTEPPMPA